MNGVYERFPIPWVVRSRQHSWCVMDANGLAIACGLTEPLARLIAGAPDAAAEIARLRARLAAWKAEAEAWRQADDCDPMVRGECIREARERRAATDAIEKNAS